MDGHFVTVRLARLNRSGVFDLAGTVPYKWVGSCSCGWRCMSWQWIAIDRPGGTLPMSLDHLKDAALALGWHELKETA